jgi:hypothetical protein
MHRHLLLVAGAATGRQHGYHGLEQWQVALYAVIIVLLVLGAGLMSGLTLGLLSLDIMDLEVGFLSHAVSDDSLDHACSNHSACTWW